MKRRRPTRLTAIVLLPLVLTGCGAFGDTDDDGTAGSTTAPGTAAAPPPDSGVGSSGGGSTAEGSAGDDGDASTDEATGPVEVTIAASGDVLAHSWVNTSARMYAGHPEPDLYPVDGASYDYTPMFADVADLVSDADLAICHMETPLSPDNTGLSVPDTLSFNTPHEMADALAGAGYDGCDFASNHTMDRGLQGVADTEQVLRDAGMGYAGPTAQEDRAGVAEVYDVATGTGSVQVAHLAYTYTYPNAGGPTLDIPGEAPWLVEASWPNLGSEGILQHAGRAKEDGADFVVVSMHWGNEYQSQPTDQQRQIASDLLASDAVDLILGTHVHVIQPCEQINGKHVIYGLGNSLSNQSPMTASSLVPATQEGMVAVFTLTRDEDGAVSTAMRYQPTRVEIPPERAPGHIIRLASPTTLPETWERTVTTVDALGGCDAEPIDPDQAP
jgi:poly-gamma-glutamate synthesis protein (capsule biosynthesis protein)